jgi:hypothetical protein
MGRVLTGLVKIESVEVTPVLSLKTRQPALPRESDRLLDLLTRPWKATRIVRCYHQKASSMTGSSRKLAKALITMMPNPNKVLLIHAAV